MGHGVIVSLAALDGEKLTKDTEQDLRNNSIVGCVSTHPTIEILCNELQHLISVTALVEEWLGELCDPGLCEVRRWRTSQWTTS